MKKWYFALLPALLLAACSQSEGKDKPAFYEEELIPNIIYTLAVQYVVDGKLTAPPVPGKVEKGQMIQVTATVENTGDNDYTFGGTPCDGDLTIAINKGGVKLSGAGDITADFCIQSYVEHTLKAGEKITASAEFNLDDVETGVYKLSSSYAKKRFVKELEITD
ncbi:hypothetical protein F9802_09045 [Bacillus aerolatus]|uniref:DUF4352 domain-containing protein n=1 Tax=Bacillus aerolatus TaxID=2653354 RepID=A0A6I1FG47_9BACI|nr:hypothetical protein [Bacillus aerolatus]KAB7707144.1 hypothetical protein F9802_09045 [Bacillus aerolatus]